MPLYRVHSKEYRIHYFAHPCSSAVLFQIGCLLLTFLLPLFSSYFTNGFYYKELSYTEQPNVTFLGKYDVIISSLSTTRIASSDARLNNYFSTYYVPSILKTSIPQDVDDDGIIDRHNLTINLILPQSISDTLINIWLLYKYNLNQYPLIDMETLGLLSLKTPISVSDNSMVTIYGELRFLQLKPVSSSTNDSSIHESLINYNSPFPVPSFDDILDKYYSRNYSTIIDPQYVQWSSLASTGTAKQLTIRISINTNPQSIRYVPSFWKEFRWAWIQYLTALLPFFYIINKIKEFVFSNGLIRTIVKKSP